MSPDTRQPDDHPRADGPADARPPPCARPAGLRLLGRVVVGGVLLVLGVWAVSPWLGSDPLRLWLPDLAASWIALLPPLAVGFALVLVVAKPRLNGATPNPIARRLVRRISRPPVLAAVGIALTPLAPLLRDRPVLPPSPAGLPDGSVTVLMVNALGNNPDHDGIARSIAGSGAGVVAMVEPPVPLQREFREPPPGSGARELLQRYPHALRRPWVEGRMDPAYLFSVWPLEPWPREPGTGATDAEREILGAIVRRPDAEGGPFVFLMTHPDSPKTLERYRSGWATVDAFAHAAVEARGLDLPLILAADLNSGPASGWSRTLTGRGGLERAKPLLEPAGTFPAWSVWPFQVAIDDVWISEGWQVGAWYLQAPNGSDHRGVVVEVAPAGSAGRSHRAGMADGAERRSGG